MDKAQTPAEGGSYIPPSMRNLASPEILELIFGPPKLKIDRLIDIAGRYSNPKTAAELDRQLAEERDAW